MDDPTAARPLPKANPELFGPLDSEPSSSAEPTRLFRGERRYFSARALDKRQRVREAVAATVARLLEEGEQLLHIAPAIHMPPLLHQIGLGWWWYYWHRVALVLTDRRVIEVLLDMRGRRPETRTLSFPWSGAKSLAIRRMSLAYRPFAGRTQKWRLERGDRKLLRRLVPLIVERRPPAVPDASRPVPLWHCPRCGAELRAKPATCESCGAAFVSPRKAATLALAFPGAGLFYTGRPVLGALDLVAEIVLALSVVMMLLTSSEPATTLTAIFVGVLFLVFTKLESAHLAQIFAARTRPVAQERDHFWSRFALVGGVSSLVAIGLPLVFVGALTNRIDRDLAFGGAAPAWSGGFDPAAWQHGKDGDQRSEWLHASGRAAFVYAFPLGPFEGLSDLRVELARAGLAEPVANFEIAQLSGIRAVDQLEGSDGVPLVRVRYFAFDADHHDLHLVETFAEPEGIEQAERDLRDLLATAEWVVYPSP